MSIKGRYLKELLAAKSLTRADRDVIAGLASVVASSLAPPANSPVASFSVPRKNYAK
jgi:hypothetical protein